MRPRLVIAIVFLAVLLTALATMRNDTDDSHTVAHVTDDSAGDEHRRWQHTSAPSTTTIAELPQEAPTPTERQCDFPSLEDWSTVDAKNELRDSVTAVLAAADDPDALATAAMIWMGADIDPAKRLTRLEKAIDASPNDPKLRFLAYDLCRSRSETRGSRTCSDSESREKLMAWIERDRDNASSWATLSLREFEAGNQKAGIAALANAATAATATHYVLETVESLEAALFGAGVPYPDSAAWAFGIAAATQSSLGLYQYCRDNAPTDAVLRQHCFGYYEVLASKSNTLLSQAVGLGAQIELLADDPSRSEHQRHLTALRTALDARREAMVRDVTAHERWIGSDRSRFYAFIDKWRSTDELTAAEFSRAERKRYEKTFDCTFEDV